MGEMSEELQRRRHLVAALRSGQRKQTREVLHRLDSEHEEGGYCCLGVACEIAIQDGLQITVQPGIKSNILYYGTGHDSSHSVLPHSVQNWYGFTDDNPYLKIPVGIIGELPPELEEVMLHGGNVAAAELNDTHQLTLDQIADCFEYTFLLEDWERTVVTR